MLATYLIGIREGLEAAIIISILIGYVVKLGERAQISRILAGAGAAVLIALGLGFALSGIEANVSDQIEITITGITSLLAVVFVTWMIFWMAKQSRSMAANLRSKVDAAVTKSSWSLASVAFLAVIREGVETSILLWSTAKSTGGPNAFGGAFLGILTAAAMGYFMYKGSLRFNLGSFFKATSVYLIVIAAGVFSYSIGEFQELGWLPFLTGHFYDLSAVFPQGSIQELVLAGAFTFNNAPTTLQAIGWLAYVLPVSYLFAQAHGAFQKKQDSVTTA
ncbi:MAG: iron uptake transporter permease EfeU [Micrococcales bacterium]